MSKYLILFSFPFYNCSFKMFEKEQKVKGFSADIEVKIFVSQRAIFFYVSFCIQLMLVILFHDYSFYLWLNLFPKGKKFGQEIQLIFGYSHLKLFFASGDFSFILFNVISVSLVTTVYKNDYIGFFPNLYLPKAFGLVLH